MSMPAEPSEASPSYSFTSVAAMWHHRIHSTPDAEAMSYKVDGVWTTINWRAAGERARNIANGLLSLGLAAEQRVGILASTSVDWILADLGILCAGGATTTVYPSNTAEECSYILGNCEAVAAFCENDAQVQKLIERRSELPGLTTIIVFDGSPDPATGVITLAELEAAGTRFAEQNPTAYDDAVAAITPESMATLIYTSGTTGHPKGVMLSHDSWVYMTEAIDKLGFISPADRQFLFLPLAHVFAKIMQVLFIRLGVPTTVDGEIPDLIDNLAYARPTWMGAVPRVFEKAYNTIVTGAHDAGGLKLSAFQWSVGIGKKVSALRQQHKEPSGLLKLQYQVAERLVFNKVRAVFGGRLRFLISGGAPLSPEIAEFFHACGILILEGYGLTESTAASCVNTPEDFIFGTVGRPVPGVDVKTADDGEILIRGRTVMRGYYNLPEQTTKSVDSDGWLHTGDLGSVLQSGHVKITGRKKNLIITAGGKNIGPAHFQNKLKATSAWVSQVLMHGDRRNYCVALVTINEDSVGKWARENGVSYVDYADLASKPEVLALVQADVDSINKVLPSYETVKKIHICPEDWTIENGFLTPSMKVKRERVETHYQEQLDAFYDGAINIL